MKLCLVCSQGKRYLFGRTEKDHTEESERHTTQEKENSPSLLASGLDDLSSQDDLLAPFEK